MAKTKSTSLALFLVLFLFGVVGSPTIASYPGNDFHAASEKDYDFSVPVGLEPQVNFWKKIYTQYTTKHGVIHDMDDPSIIYEVVYLGEQVLSSRMRGKKVRPKIAKYKKILSKLARVKNQSRLSSEEKRVADLVKYNFSRASRKVRMQLGQKDRFKEGIRISGRYMERIKEIFKDAGLPEELTVLPHVESSFQVNAFSSAGAAGIWQFTRRTGRRFMKIGYEVDERKDPILSAYAAAKLLKYNYDQIKSWPLAITAYNHGLRGMERAKKKFGDDIVQIIKHYRKRTFGFASKNFFAEFLAALDVALQTGRTVDRFCEHLIDHLRTLMLLRVCGAETELVDVADSMREELAKQAACFDGPTYVYMITLLEELKRSVRFSGAARALADAAVVRLAMSRSFTDISGLLAQLDKDGPSTSASSSARSSAPAPEDEKKNAREPRPVAAPAAPARTVAPPAPRADTARPAASPPRARTAADTLSSAEWQQVANDPLVRRVQEAVDGRITNVRRADKSASTKQDSHDDREPSEIENDKATLE